MAVVALGAWGVGDMGLDSDWDGALTAEEEAMMAALAAYTPDVDLEAEFPAIGATYAQEVRVTCAAP